MTDKHEVEEHVTEDSLPEEKSHIEADGEELSQAVVKAAEQAKEKASVAAEKAKELTGKATETVSEYVTKENLEKVTDKAKKVLDKVESYNKNHLFEKIIFAVIVCFELTFLYFFWSTLQVHQLSGGGVQSFDQGLQTLGTGLNGMKSLYQAVSIGRILVLVLLVMLCYGTIISIKKRTMALTNVRILSYGTVILTLFGNIFATQALKALAASVDAMNGNWSSIFGLAGMSPDAISSGVKVLVVFYILAAVTNTGALYLLYQKLFAKK